MSCFHLRASFMKASARSLALKDRDFCLGRLSGVLDRRLLWSLLLDRSRRLFFGLGDLFLSSLEREHLRGRLRDRDLLRFSYFSTLDDLLRPIFPIFCKSFDSNRKKKQTKLRIHFPSSQNPVLLSKDLYFIQRKVLQKKSHSPAP